MNEETLLVWNDFVNEVATSGDPKMLDWMKNLIPVEYNDEQQTFVVATKFKMVEKRIMRDYKDVFENFLEQITMDKTAFACVYRPDLFVASAENAGEVSADITVPASPGMIQQPAPTQSIIDTQAQIPPAAVMPIASGTVPQIQTEVDRSFETPVVSQQVAPFEGQPHVTNTPLSQQGFLSVPAGVYPGVQTEVINDAGIDILTAGEDSKYTFETFVMGNSNSIAATSAQKVAAEPGRAFNPFFLYSRPGLGKTHLLLAIQNYIHKYYPAKKTMYMSAEKFVQDYLEELSNKSSYQGTIMKKYRNVDVLLIDDVQFLEEKQESQYIFFDIFNDLVQHDKQVVLSADRAPRFLKMNERLTSRFASVLAVDIQYPDYELKYAILKNFYTRIQSEETWYQGTVSDELLRYIAEIANSNIRELEGFFTKVLVNTTNKNQRGEVLTKDDILKLAGDMFDIASKRVEIETIQHVVERHYNISHNEIIGSKRTKNINYARQVAMWISRDMTDEALATIGKKFGNRDHTTIMNGVAKIDKIQKEDRLVRDSLERLMSQIVDKS